MRTIRTKYLPFTNHKGERVKATLAETLLEGQKPMTATVGYSYEKSVQESHRVAALALLSKLGDKWGNAWARGAYIDEEAHFLGNGEYAFIVRFKDLSA